MAKKRNRREHHVVPNKDGGWDVKVNKACRRTFHTRKKSTAIKKARALSRKHKTELVIHSSHGRIQVSNSHSVVKRGKPGPKPKKRRTKVKHTRKNRRRSKRRSRR